MKKIFALSLCFIMIFTFTACSNDRKKNNDDIDLEYYAKLGQIPEMPFKLSSDCQMVEEQLQTEYDEFLSNDPHSGEDHDHDHDVEEIYLNIKDNDDHIFIDNGTKYYLYKKSEKKNGISCIVTFGDAFGIKMSTFIYEVKNSMSSIEFDEAEIEEGDIFFAEYLSSGTVLKTEFDGVTILFVFQDSELYATAMYKTNSWE